MKKVIPILLVALAAMFFSVSAFSSDPGLASLRGDYDLKAMSKKPEKMKVQVVEGGIERSYKIQPPMIPHKIEKEKITIKTNTCLKCHSEKNYKKEKAPKIGDSHYLDRDGNETKTVASRRWFCNQCHAVQLSGEPLVQNDFEGAK